MYDLIILLTVPNTVHWTANITCTATKNYLNLCTEFDPVTASADATVNGRLLLVYEYICYICYSHDKQRFTCEYIRYICYSHDKQGFLFTCEYIRYICYCHDKQRFVFKDSDSMNNSLRRKTLTNISQGSDKTHYCTQSASFSQYKCTVYIGIFWHWFCDDGGAAKQNSRDTVRKRKNF